MHPEEDLFEEAKLLNGLSKKNEKILYDCLYSYITETYSNEPVQREIIACCEAVVQLFPHLETKPSQIGGIVSRIEYVFTSSRTIFFFCSLCFQFYFFH